MLLKYNKLILIINKEGENRKFEFQIKMSYKSYLIVDFQLNFWVRAFNREVVDIFFPLVCIFININQVFGCKLTLLPICHYLILWINCTESINAAQVDYLASSF